MTTGMDDRRDAFEKKFALDAELRFKAEARRNKLLGLWVAERLGKKDAEAEAYAREVVAADFEEAAMRMCSARSVPIWTQQASAPRMRQSAKKCSPSWKRRSVR